MHRFVLEAVTSDFCYSLRVFRRNKAFPAVVVIALALGIGANTAILSVAYAVLVRPLPFERPDEIYSVQIVVPERRDQIPSLAPAVQVYLEWRRAQTVFSSITALRPWEATLADGEPERLGGARVSTNFFSFLGIGMSHGHDFRPDQEQPGNENVVVISDGLWRRRYGGDPDVIGRRVTINGVSHTIVGVAPASPLMPTGTQLHAFVAFAPRVDVWKPIAPTPRELEEESWDHGVFVRLPDGAGVEQGREQLAALVNAWARARLPGINTQVSVELVPIRQVFSGAIRLRLLLVLAASGLLLLSACASVATVMLARVATRAGELSTRIALGASRWRILSQVLTETILLAAAGGAAGGWMAGYGARLLAAYGPTEVQRLASRGVQAPLLLAAALVSLATGTVCGIMPAWHACRRDPADSVHGTRLAAGAPADTRARHGLVAIEMALATVLLATASLLLRSFVNVLATGRGYDVEHVLTIELPPGGDRNSAPGARSAFYSMLVDGVRGVPGVDAVGAISNLPASAESEAASRTIFHPTDTNFRRLVLARPVAMIRSVTSGYFTASGTVLRAGRFVSEDERAPVAVISESLARRLWPGEAFSAALGRQFRQGDVTGPLILVVGVVADAQFAGLERAPLPAIYRPYVQWQSSPMTLVLKTRQDPAALVRAVRSQIRYADPNLPIPAARTMREIVSSAVAPRRFQMALTTLFGAIALLLGAVGVYGVVSFAVDARTREMGVRIALGATRADVMRLVFARGLRPVGLGLAVGLAGSVAAARALRGLLFGVTPQDPVALGAVTLVLVSTAALACYLPARRAAALDPALTLRHE